MRITAKEAKEWARSLRGVIDTFPTPYTEEGEIDEADLRKLVSYHYDSMKSDGLYILGGTAEAWFLTKEERKRCCDILIDEARKVKPDAPVIMETSCTSPKETVELTKHAEKAGASVVMLLNPLFATDEDAIYDFYHYVAENTNIAIMLMNIQGIGGTFYMSPNLIARLAQEIPAICANRGRKIAVVVDEDIDVYNTEEVLWAIGNRVRGELDMIIIPRLPSLDLSPCARDESGFHKGILDTKIVIDATEPEGFATRVTPHKQLWESMKLEDYLK
ncbi:dihydrodipicolinate synthase family protein [Chloroflexota bacterium]